jgi:translation initiation factor IF-1
MAKQANIKQKGTVIENLSNDKFKIELDNGHFVTAYPCGKMRKNFIKILVGDTVTVDVSPYDITQGIIRFIERKR